MKVYELFVDDKSYDTEDGYTLLFTEAYTLAVAVETAIKNGFEDIRISEANITDKLEYMKRYNEQHPEMEIR